MRPVALPSSSVRIKKQNRHHDRRVRGNAATNRGGFPNTNEIFLISTEEDRSGPQKAYDALMNPFPHVVLIFAAILATASLGIAARRFLPAGQ